MAYDIGPRISIKGETEFNRSIQQINQNLKEYGSELKVVSSQFEENAQSQDALIAKNNVMQKQYDEQTRKAKILSEQIEKHTSYLKNQANEIQRLTKEYGENSSEVKKAQTAYTNTESVISKLKIAFNETTATSNKLSNEIRENTNKLDQMANGTRDAVTGFERIQDSADDTAKALDKTGDSAYQLNENFKSAFGAEQLASAASSIKSLLDGMIEGSKEYMKIMGSLELSSERAGYSAEQTTQIYRTFYGVLGDDQTAATSTANLQALGLEQNKLQEITYGTIGAWATYGDSIPIDSLSEAINETIRVGQVTGTFADMLNWAGTSEDEFNQKLAQCSTESERVNLVLEEMANQGLANAGRMWSENNKNLVESNQAQAEYQATTAELAETVLPVYTMINQLLTGLLKMFTSLPEPVQIATVALIAIISALGSLAPIITAIGVASGASAVPVGTLSAALLPITGIVLAIVAAITAIILVIANWGEITDWFSEKWSAFTSWLQEKWQAFSGWFGVKSQEFMNFWKNLPGNIMNFVVNLPNQLLNFGEDLMREFAAGILRTMGVPEERIDELVDTIVNTFLWLPRNAVNWGKDMLTGFADGIMSGFNWVKEKVNGVINWISERLHFSVPDKGPLSKADTWMPDFMKLLASGIHNNRYRVEDEINSLMDTMEVNGNIHSSSRTVTKEETSLTTNVYLDGRKVFSNMDKHAGQRQTALSMARG